jgi:hypothetical protein
MPRHSASPSPGAPIARAIDSSDEAERLEPVDRARGRRGKHQVGLERDDPLDRGVLEPADARQRRGLRREVRPAVHAEQPVARTERADRLGARRQQRHDAPRGRGERHRAAAVVDDRDRAGALDARAGASRALRRRRRERGGRDGEPERDREPGAQAEPTLRPGPERARGEPDARPARRPSARARGAHRFACGAQRSVTNISRPGWLKPYAVS